MKGSEIMKISPVCYGRPLWLPALMLSTLGPLHAETLHLSFGVYTSDKPTVMYRMFKPILSHLESKASRKLNRRVKIKLRIYKSYDSANNALVSGKIDFVRFGPASYVIAKKENPRISLLAVEQRSNDPRKAKTFYGVIFARKDSGIESLADLKGKTFAFGDEFSTIGRYLSQATLLDAGVCSRDLAGYAYLGRHDKVVTSVLHGKFAAGAAKESTYRKYAGNDLVVLRRFKNVTKPWVARAGLDPAVKLALRSGLLSIEDPKILGAISSKLVGFGMVEDSEYEDVRQDMQESIERWTSCEGRPTPTSSLHTITR